MKAGLPRLHAVTSDAVLNLADFDSRARALCATSDVAIHVRSGTVGGRHLWDTARRLLSAGGFVLVNDRVDIASAVGAAGVHLPAAGLGISDARRLLGDEMIIGRSAHTPEEAAQGADEGADYVFLGPIWSTASHPDRPPLGPKAISAAAQARVIAIGGVTPERVPICLQHGAYGVAAVTGLWLAPDPGSAARSMSVLLDR